MRAAFAVWLVVCASVAAGCTFFPVKDRISNPGSDARDLASPARYPTLRVELDHPDGYGPDTDAVNAFREEIAGATGRDVSRVVIETSPEIPAEPSRKYSWSDIQALENAHRSRHTSGDAAALYVLYVAGGSEADSSAGQVLGAAYHGTSIVMFKGNIKANTDGGALSGKPPTAFVERAVLVHEAGHTMGLVNLGAPMVSPHEDTRGGQGDDPARHGHSSNKQSVMYWAVESSSGLAGLVNCLAFPSDCGIPFHYDADDKADLRALQDR